MRLHISLLKAAVGSVLAKNPEVDACVQENPHRVFLCIRHNPGRHEGREPIANDWCNRVRQLTAQEVEQCATVMREVAGRSTYKALLLGVVDGMFEYQVSSEE